MEWTLTTAWEYIGDDDVTFQGKTDVGYTNKAKWSYNSPIGEPCNATKVLTLVSSQVQGFVDMWSVQTDPEFYDSPTGFGSDDDDQNEPTFHDDGVMCNGGPNFPNSVTLTAT